MQGFYDDFAKATSDGNLTTEEIETLRKAYLAASEKAKADFEALSKATGVDLMGNETTGSALSKAIKGITSDQANALEGIYRGVYEQTKVVASNTAMLVPMNNTMGKMFDIAKQSLGYAAETAFNTANTVTELRQTNQKLDKVISNTKGSGGSLRDTGLGGML